MGEYQYYEFRALDRGLTNEEMKNLRSYSTRAQITKMRTRYQKRATLMRELRQMGLA